MTLLRFRIVLGELQIDKMPAHDNNAKVWDQLLMGRHYSSFALATVGSELVLSN